MAQFGKASSKKGKPNYTGAIIGVALVLFLFGIVGWFFLNLRKTGDYFKESIQVHTYLNRDASKKQIDSLTAYISSIPYVNRVEHVTKEMALQKWNNENDSTWKKFLNNNPLPESIDFYVKADHVEKDSLNLLAVNLQTAYPGLISEFHHELGRRVIQTLTGRYPDKFTLTVLICDFDGKKIAEVSGGKLND